MGRAGPEGPRGTTWPRCASQFRTGRRGTPTSRSPRRPSWQRTPRRPASRQAEREDRWELAVSLVDLAIPAVAAGGRQRRRRRYRRHAGQYTAAVEAAEQRGELPVQWRAPAEGLHKIRRPPENPPPAAQARAIIDTPS